MIHIKKTILTLALLITAATGAWAEETPLLTIKNKDYTSFLGGSKTFDDKVTVTFSNSVFNFGDEWGWTAVTTSLLTVAGINGYTITSCKFYTLEGPAAYGYTVEGKSPSVYLVETKVYTDDSKSVNIGEPGIKKIEVYGAAASSATPVPLTWDATAKTATLTNGMPAGNVTFSVDYFPKATADGAVTAATDAKATTDAPLVTVDATQLTGAAKMMYYVSTSTTAPAYGAEGWTDVLPTAEKYTEAASLNVWYYPVGTDEGVGGATATYSDGDMNATALTVTLDAPPTYDVCLNKTGLATGEPANWKAKSDNQSEVNLGTNDLEGVKKGDEVTVTYTGTRKVIGVKAEKTDTKYLKWDDSQKKLVPTKIPATATKVENVNDYVTWAAGTYLVEGDVTISGAISLSGDVDLIIMDGAKLNVNQIDGYNSSLSVYGQINMSGELNVVTSDFDAIVSMTALNIHSCKVNAISSKSARGGIFKISEVNVYGGSVVAENTGGSNGYGILDAPLNIYGGEVKAVCKASSGSSSFGISGVHGETVTVYGGKLWAECAVNKAIYSNVTLTKGEGFNGKIETSDNGTDWSVYSGTGTPEAKYVRVGY